MVVYIMYTPPEIGHIKGEGGGTAWVCPCLGHRVLPFVSWSVLLRNHCKVCNDPRLPSFLHSQASQFYRSYAKSWKA